MHSKVSIVVPVYNKIEYIDMMLESVYDQIWDNIELILVNDGATDGTRERLSAWESRFIKRGYNVIIIDQENQGIPSAVKAGLGRVTGDYVCLADCDDYLDPGYASTMAGWLDEHSEDKWAACLCRRVTIENGEHRILSIAGAANIPSPPLMMEKYLSAKYVTDVWIYMVRTSYLRECEVVERYITDIRSTQEPGFLFPLILGGGKLEVIDKPLYNHNHFPERTSAHKSAAYAVGFQDKYREMIVKNIDSLPVDASKKKKWRIMAELAHKSFLLPSLEKLDTKNEFLPKLASEAAALISKYFKPDPRISARHIMEHGYSVLSTAVADCILHKKMTGFTGMTIQAANRIIGCGALGAGGKKQIPRLIDTLLEPTILWDRNASPSDTYEGIPVAKPDFNSLTWQDIVFIFPYDSEVRAQLQSIVMKHGVKNIFFDYDIDGFQPMFKYPQFYGEYKFVVE